jgi:MerR family transcriptional regulator, thiopeptide resistance regulator
MSKSLYQVREFAERSGVTVRTLHHYDHLGLLKPTVYSESGYRLYSDRDLARLQQIVTLKFIGFTLRQIKELLDGDELDDLATTLRHQRKTMERKRTQLDAAIGAIGKAERVAASGAEPDPELFKQIIEVITMESNNEFFKNYYSEEQLEDLAKRRAENPGEAEQGTRDWAELIKEVEASLDEDPAGEKAQALAARWMGLVQAFTKGDPGLSDSLKKLYADKENWPPTFKKPYSDEVEAFIGKAMAAGKKG